MKHLYLRKTACLFLIVLVAACSGGATAPNSSKVTIAVISGHNAAQAPGVSKAKPVVATLLFTISGNDMDPMTKTITVSTQTTVIENFIVPNGAQRTFRVDALDSSGAAKYSGSTAADLSGPPVTVDIDMKPLFFTGTQLLGTVQSDFGTAIAQDGKGNTYIAGITYGNFNDPTNTNITSQTSNVFFTKFDLTGAQTWTVPRQFGDNKGDYASGIAVDKDGNIIIVGFTMGNLFGETNQGYYDCFVAKFDSSGQQLWTRLIGGKEYDWGNAVALDASGNVYVTGYSTQPGGQFGYGQYDIFVAKLDSSGAQQWLNQYGTPTYDSSEAIAVDSVGNVYVAGHTYGDLDGNVNAGVGSTTDAFVTKFDPQGNIKKTQQFGTPDIDQATTIAIDTNGVIYVAGQTNGNLNNVQNSDQTGSTADIFVVKFDSGLATQSTWLLGTSQNDEANSIAADANGSLFLTGRTNGTFTNETNAGGYDCFAGKFKPTGEIEWAHQIGTSADDEGKALVIDGKGNALVTGSTKGIFDGVKSSGVDAFLVMYDKDGVKQ